MNKIIEGRRYNTESATLLAHWSVGFSPRDNDYYNEYLYVTKSGNYFLYGKGNAGSKYNTRIQENAYTGSEDIEPIPYERARKYAEVHLKPEEYEAIFEVIDDEVNSDAGDEKIHITLPTDLLKTLRERKETTGANVSFQIAKVLREAGY